MGTPGFLSRYSREYDLFINSTQGSSLPCQAELGALVAFFPLPLEHPYRYRIGKALQSIMLLGVRREGFFPSITKNPHWRYSCGDSAVSILAWPPGIRRALTVELHLEPPPDAPLPYPVTIRTPEEQEFLLSGDETIRLRDYPRDGKLLIEIHSPQQQIPGINAPVGVMLRHIHVPSYRRLFIDLLNRTSLRKTISEIASLGELPTPEGIQSYDEVWAISKYTQHWVQELWNRDSKMLYPPADLAKLAPAKEKENWILSVGRFFAGGHNKKHAAMIQIFKELVNEGLQGWELHLTGGTMASAGGIHLEYLARLQELAQGYPIHFHLDVPFAELKDLYGRSKIYWHAAGIGENPDKHPKRFEHFGITVVEAMAAGAVPVVIRGGGLPETVQHGKDGLLWRDAKEWKQQTISLIENPDEMERLRQSALQRSREFGMDRFEHDLLELVAQMGVL
jgi:glycosyltransferase involved in cell wall biosynthesis